MGARLSRAGRLAAKELTFNRQVAAPRSPPEQPSVVTRVSGLGVGSGADAVGGDRGGSDEWAGLLNRISGGITSKTWGGTVGVRPSSVVARDKSLHVARRSRATVEKLPKRRDAMGEEFDAVGPVHGSLTQNQILDVFRLLRNDKRRWGAAQVAERFALSEVDARNLLWYNRTFLAMEEEDISRGVYHPDAGVERFEDLNGKAARDELLS
jgi:Uncharacterised protein family (UPF0240)